MNLSDVFKYFHDPAHVAMLFWGISVFVDSMPALKPTSSVAYTWLHNLLQGVAGNLSKLRTGAIPSMPAK